MTGFLKWTARYGRNKFYKMLLFFILFVVLSFFVSSCKVHAATTDLSGNFKIYATSGDCSYDSSSTNFNCVKGASYKIVGNNNDSNNVDIPYIINNANNDVLINNVIYEVNLDSPLTISSSQHSVYLKFGKAGYSNGVWGWATAASSGYGFSYMQFSASPLDQSTDSGKSIPITYGFKPYYCSYHNPDTDTTSTCNLILDIGNDTWFKIILNLSNGTKLDKFTIHFGSPTLISTIGSKTINNILVPDSNTIVTSSYGNYSISYDNWRRSSSTPIGVQYLKQGVSWNSPTLTPPKDSFVRVDSNTYTSNAYQWNYSALSNELVAQYQSQVSEIEEELTPPPDDDDISGYVDGFVDSSESNSFLNLFNALIQYPISRFNQQSSYGLTYTNIHGDEILSDVVCRGLVYPGDFGEKLKFTWNGKYFYFPCVHYDVYAEIYSDNFAFYPTYVNNAQIQHGNNKNLYSIIKIVLDGFLIYVLFINCLHIYKYIFDSDDKQIEVLDL